MVDSSVFGTAGIGDHLNGYFQHLTEQQRISTKTMVSKYSDKRFNVGIYENFFKFLECVGKTTILVKNYYI